MKCKKCGTENLDGTKYCQNCGNELKLKNSSLPWGNAKALAGLGHKGSSIAPLGAISIEKQAEELGGIIKKNHLVKVCPLPDGTWYCPDCGERNKTHAAFCKGCGRDYV